MPREGGASSTPRPFRIQQTSLEYWIIRPSAQGRTRRMMTGGFEAAVFAQTAQHIRLRW